MNPAPPTIDAPAAATGHLEPNLLALAKIDPETASFLRRTPPIDGATAATGRDGSQTFTWRDADGRLHWLGRSSMPTISAPALLDAFQPGNGNCLFVDIGHGGEVARLAPRLCAHQAVFVVIEHPAEAVLALQLHDFSSDIEAGRIVLCAAEDPWARLTAFLSESPGYLTPDRVLCRPWYEQAYTTELSRRIEQLVHDVDALRSKSAAPRPGRAGSTDGFRLAIVTNVLDPAIARLADSLEDAAESLGWSCRRHTLATPRWVNPHAIETDLHAFKPDMCLVIGAAVRALAYKLPDCPTAVICAHVHGLSQDWLGQIPPSVSIVARAPDQIGQLRDTGVNADRLIHWPPAARACAAAAESGLATRVFVLCDGLGSTPEAVGLNLDTHQKLWHESRRLIEAQADAYTDADAESILRTAARRLSVTLQSEEVIAGLTLRIRTVLGPAVVREVVLSRLVTADVPIEIYGAGRFANESLAAIHRGPWPGPRASATLAANCRAAVAIETAAAFPDGFLDCAAAGAALFQRAAVAKLDAARFAGIEAVGTGVRSFRSAGDLIKQVSQLTNSQATPGGHSTRAFLVNTHTWAHRLEALRARLVARDPSSL